MDQALQAAKRGDVQLEENVSSRATLGSLFLDFTKTIRAHGAWFYASWMETPASVSIDDPGRCVCHIS
jgi:hypothetical protein